MNVRATLFICGLLIMTGPARPILAAELKMGVVNVQDVLDTVDEGKKAVAEFKKAIDAKKVQLDDKQKEYKKAEENLEKQKLILAPNALAEKQKELDARREELQKYVLQLNAEMKQKEMQLSGDILKKIRAVTEKIGQEGGYTVILEKNESGVVFYKDALDVTKQVIEQYNKAYGKKG